MQCRISTTDKSSHQPSQNRTIPRKPPIPLTCFAPSPLPPLSKVRCCRPKKFGRLPEGLPHQPSPRTNPSKNRTISLAFRRMSVCVCLVGFASLQSTWAHTLRHPCLACSSRCIEPLYSRNHCKRTIIPQKSPSHLPPLSKVRCCRRKNSGDYRRDCHTYRTLSVSLTPPLTIPHSTPNPPKTAPSLENHQHPCLAFHHHPCLPSKKGRWLDGIAKPLFYIIFIL